MILYDAIQAHAMDVQSATYGRDWFERIRREATAEWLAVRKLLKQFEKDIQAGNDAGREVNG